MVNPMIDDALNALREDILKAAETISSYTFDPDSRSVFSPQNLDEKIKFLAPKDTPLRNRLPRTTGLGEAAVWKRMTSKVHSGMHAPFAGAAGSGTTTSIFFQDAGAPNETSQTYDTVSQGYKLLGRKLEVGGFALAASKGRAGQPDQQTDREKVKMVELMIGEEEALINGDVSHSALEFNGLFKQITTYSGNVSFLTSSGIGASCKTLYPDGGDPTLLLGNARQLLALTNDLESTGSIMRNVISDQTGVVGGYAVTRMVNPITQSTFDVRPSRFVGYSSLLLTEKTAAGENCIEVEDLISMSRVDVPSGNFSYISFVLEATAPKVIWEPYQMEITVGPVS